MLTCGAGVLFNLFLRFYSVGGKPIFFRSVFSSLDTIFQSLVLHSYRQITGRQHTKQDNSYPDPAAETQVSGTQNNHTTRTQNTTDEHTTKNATPTHDKQLQPTRQHHTKNTKTPRHPHTTKNKNSLTILSEAKVPVARMKSQSLTTPVCFVRAILLIYDITV